MSRPNLGNIQVRTLRDGTRVFKLRFHVHGEREQVVLHERRDCACGCKGGWNERTAAAELQNILSRVRAGIWRKREPPPRIADGRMPTFHEYASDWLQAKLDGVLGDRPIGPSTAADYRARLANHLLPYFGEHRLDDIDAELCVAFKAHKLREAAELRRTIEAGIDVRDRRGRRVVPLGPASIRRLIACLTSILDEAVDDGHLERNPARGRRMRVKVPRPARSFLEMDELVALTDAAGGQDARSMPNPPPPASNAARVAERWAAGRRPTDIAADLGMAKGTVGHHLRRLRVQGPAVYVGRRAIVATLGGAGVRVSELCDIRIRDLRLHAATGAHFRIPDAKTEAGIREVQVSPDLLDELTTHLQRLERAGYPTGPDAFLFPQRRGGRMARQRATAIVREAASLASTRLADRGLPALPNTTAHTLRRTYISVALLANKFDVLWVMNQVGHADSKMTLEVYAQLQQRANRQHGETFDKLVREARERLYGTEPEPLSDDEPPAEPDARVRPEGEEPTAEDDAA